MSDKGYIKLNRKLFEHRLWCEEREFSMFEAWLDLIKSARFEDATQSIGKYQTQLVKRGQIAASIRFLSQRWKWSTKKIVKYLGFLESHQMITKETSTETGITVITLSNYDTYNQGSAKTETARKRQKSTENNKPLKNDTARNTAADTSANTPNRTVIISNYDTYNQGSAKTETVKETVGSTPKGLIGTQQGNGRDTNISNYKELNNISSNEDIACALSENSDSLKILISEKEKSCAKKEKSNFEKFQLWVKTNAASVARMKEPFTLEQFERLKGDFNIEFIQGLLLEMHNWKPLLSKNINANATFRRWAKKEKTNANNTLNSTAPSLHIDTKGKYPDKP